MRQPKICRAQRLGATLVAALLLALPVHAEETDEAFLEGLSRGSGPVDVKRLARLFFSVASTLDGGKTSLRWLQSAISARDPNRESTLALAGTRFDEYVDTVERFKADVGRLLDRPDSTRALYRVLVNGQRTCWRLDAYVGLLETYGVSGNDLLSALSSTEACDRFRRAAFQPRVERMIEDGLVDQSDLAEENRYLREELRELERLIEDLRSIDEDE